MTIKRAGVLGWPIAHSLSPLVHGFWLKKYCLEGDYVRIAVEPKHLSEKIKALQKQNFVGGNVTVPHKETALKLADEVHPLALKIGAVNTFVFQKDGTMYGFNTDGYGFLENLRAGCKSFNFAKGPAVVLGAGGAARAILVALQEAGVPEIRLLNRTQEKAQHLAQDFNKFKNENIHVYDWCDRADHLAGANLLVNTTILGMEGQACLDLDLANLPREALVTDIVYTPLETDLLKRAKLQGNRVVDGLGMLLHQARPGFEAWFGVLPDVTPELRKYVLRGQM